MGPWPRSAAPGWSGWSGPTRPGLVWFEAKIHLSRPVETTETGAETEVVIARNGRPVASGQFTLPDSIDAADPHKAQAPLPLGIDAAAFAGQAPGETFMPG